MSNFSFTVVKKKEVMFTGEDGDWEKIETINLTQLRYIHKAQKIGMKISSKQKEQLLNELKIHLEQLHGWSF